MAVNWRIQGLMASAVALWAAGSCAAYAQPGDASQAGANEVADGAVEEIIVTAQKRSERLKDVPMSITAITGDALAQAGITEPAKLVQSVPGFNYQMGAFGTPILSIRGIGYADNSTSAGPAVTTYLDQMPLPYSVMSRGAVLDLERVEVLKGPQGTLFGMNSTGGAVNFIAAKPTEDMTAGFNVGYARFHDFTMDTFISGAVNDQLGVRVALQYENADGWQYSSTRSGDRLGAKQFINGRVIMDWRPSDTVSLELTLNAWHDESETQAAQFVGVAPAAAATPATQPFIDALLASPVAGNNPREANWDAGRNYERDDNYQQASLRADIEIADDVSLTSLTSYSDFKGNSPMDIDGTDFTAFDVREHKSRLKTFSQELRLAGTAGGARWMLGGNYQHEDTNETTYTLNQGTQNQIGPFQFSALGQLARQKVKTISGFGSLDYNLTDKLKIQGSARYASQKRSFAGCISDAGPGIGGVNAGTAFEFLSGLFTGSAVTIPAGGCVTLSDTTFLPTLAQSNLNEDNFSWRLSADYRIDRDTLVYANVTRGYKAGSYGLVPAILASQFVPVTQESVTSYEVGMRAAPLGSAMSIELAGFYSKYDNKQLKGLVYTGLIFGYLPELINIPKSYVLGFEANTVLRPLSGLQLKGGATYVKTRVEKDPGAPALPVDPFGNSTSYVGDSFPNTPKWQFVGDAEYRFPLWSGGMYAVMGAAVTHHGSAPGTFGNVPIFTLPAYTLLDLRIGLESGDGHWSGRLWANNVTNEFYYTNVTHLTDYISRLSGPPATYGVTIRYKF